MAPRAAHACAVAAAVALLAGCLGDPAPAQPAAAVPDPLRIEWTGCEGLAVSVDGPAPLYRAHATVPAGWAPAASPTATVQVSVRECQRIAWGPFERGPVVVLQEWHGEFEDPPACHPGPASLRVMLESIWFSDAEVAAYASERHGMPAHHGAFRFARDDAGPAASWSVAWSEPGGPESTATLFEQPASLALNKSLVRRVYWANGGGVSAMEMHDTFRIGSAGSAVAAGTLPSPMLHGRSSPDPAFATAEAGLQRDASARAAIDHYKDTQCRTPA